MIVDGGVQARVYTRNFADFEGGNIGALERTGAQRWRIKLRDDNDDALPLSWRQWYYFRIDELPVEETVSLNFEGLGQSSYFLPFYSLNNELWIQFPEAAVTQPKPGEVLINWHFPQKMIWFARYIPYHYTRLLKYLQRFNTNPEVMVSDIGKSSGGQLIPLVTITDTSATQGKQRIIIHARTHPGEVGSSFLIEGFINFLTSDQGLARYLKQRFVFSIIPMLNVDGVMLGNNRTSAQGLNLEGKWFDGSGLSVDQRLAPVEVKRLNKAFISMVQSGIPISLALNLHASGGQPEDNTFSFPHFGPAQLGYNVKESNLFENQTRFMEILAEIHGRDLFNPLPREGGRDFLGKHVPESWWWRHFQDQVTALTIETTYGRAGQRGHWVKPSDLRRLGGDLARAIARYHEATVATSGARKINPWK